VADEISSTRRIGQIQPPNRSRDAGMRQRASKPQPKKRDNEEKGRRPDGGSNKHVDEYA
jgi:hypothetical protein